MIKFQLLPSLRHFVNSNSQSLLFLASKGDIIFGKDRWDYMHYTYSWLLSFKGKKQLGFSPARDHDILPSPVTPFKFSSPPTWVPPSNLTTGKVGMVASLSCCEGHDSLKRGCTLRSLDHHTSLQRASETSGKGRSLRGVFSVLGKHEPWTLRLKDQGSNSSSAGNTFFDCCLSK